MKKEILASVLTLSAGMASVISYPQQSLARSVRVEKELAKSVSFKSSVPVRRVNEDGTFTLGRIYLKLDQEKFTPEGQNQLHGEMLGSLYFISDEPTSRHSGQEYYTYEALGGEDGRILLDRTHKADINNKRDNNHYQVYSCNSTMTWCNGSSFAVFVSGKVVQMHFIFEASQYQKFEVYQEDYVSPWRDSAFYVPMVQID